jgi:hypothetical protein
LGKKHGHLIDEGMLMRRLEAFDKVMGSDSLNLDDFSS